MKNRIRRILALIAVCHLCFASAVASAAPKIDKTGLKDSQEFAFELYRALYAKESDEGNLAMSPLSVQLALSMATNGARSSTRTGMLKGLQSSSLDRLNRTNQALIGRFEGTRQGADVRISNGLFLQKGFSYLSGFQSANKKYYGAKLTNLDFGDGERAADEINDWVNTNTQGLIPKLVDGMSVQDAISVLVNTVYFNGLWTSPFPAYSTVDEEFTTLGGAKKNVSMMHNTPKQLEYVRNADYAATRLPYGDGKLAMSLFLPAAGTEKAFLSEFSYETWQDWRKNAKVTDVKVSLPKFEQRFSVSLKPELADMGMTLAFTPRKADFSYMVKNAKNNLFISDVVHSVYVRVDEKGTEAAAATGVVVGTTGLIIGAEEITFDRPFVYVIEDTESGAVLFVGSVGNPAK